MNSEETLKQHNEILEAIAALSSKIDSVNKRIDGLEDYVHKRIDGLDKRIEGLDKKFDGLEQYVHLQFEAVRQGIVDNAIKFDRLESQIYLVRSDHSQLQSRYKRGASGVGLIPIFGRLRFFEVVRELEEAV
jgi:predicted nuclease with TOPRIM domain